MFFFSSVGTTLGTKLIPSWYLLVNFPILKPKYALGNPSKIVQDINLSTQHNQRFITLYILHIMVSCIRYNNNEQSFSILAMSLVLLSCWKMNCLSPSLSESFRCLLANPRWAVMCLLLRCGFSLATLPNRPDWWSAVEMLVLLKGFPLSTEKHWSSVRVAIGFLVTSLTKTLLPQSLSLAGRPALRRVLLVANFFLIRIMEATVLILGLQCW